VLWVALVALVVAWLLILIGQVMAIFGWLLLAIAAIVLVLQIVSGRRTV
jgi:hypothetical protein